MSATQRSAVCAAHLPCFCNYFDFTLQAGFSGHLPYAQVASDVAGNDRTGADSCGRTTMVQTTLALMEVQGLVSQ